jgi:hypothetical protein
MEATSVKIYLCSHMLKSCRCSPWFSNKVINTKIAFRTALQLGAYKFLSAIVFLLQTPVPNYQDVDLSFVYEIQFPTVDPVKLEQNSPYSFFGEYICFASKFVELQMSSPQIAEFIRFAKVYILIA